LLTLNVPLRIGKCTLWGTCTPGWEPLLYTIGAVSQSHKHNDSCAIRDPELEARKALHRGSKQQ